MSTTSPDSAFACVDDEGRHYPHHDADGALDLPHLRAALSRVGDPANTQCGKGHLEVHAVAEDIGQGKAAAVKATVLDEDHLRLLAIPYGGPIPRAGAPYGVDVQGEWFSPNTDIKPDWLDVRLVDWHHGGDSLLGREVLGRATDLTQEEDGWWVDLWLDRGAKRLDLVRKLAERGAQLFGSSETLRRLVKTSPDGEILQWPYLRQTLSTSPVNTLSVVTGKAMLAGATPSATFWADFPAYLASDLPTAATIGQQGAELKSGEVERMLDDSLTPWTMLGADRK